MLAWDNESQERRACVAKQEYNFLRGWLKQLRSALDEGLELAYETAELVDESLDLIAAPDGDDDDLDRPEYRGGGDAPELDGGTGEGDDEGVLHRVPELASCVRRDEPAKRRRLVDGGVPAVAGAESTGLPGLKGGKRA